MERFDPDHVIVTLAMTVNQHGGKAGPRGAVIIIFQAVADVQALLRRNRHGVEGRLKDTPAGLGRADRGGGGDALEIRRKSQLLDNREESVVPVGNDAQAVAVRLQKVEHRDRVVEQAPALGPREEVVEFLEERLKVTKWR